MQSQKSLISNKEEWMHFLSNAKIFVELNWRCEKKSKCTKDDFEFFHTLGKGSFGKVVLGRNKFDKSLHAIKMMDKNKAMNPENVANVLNERRALQTTDFCFIIHMNYFFSDEQFIYFAMTYIPGGDLWHELRKRRKFSEQAAKFFACQVLLALEYLHYIDLIYRDLKPENILIDADGYIKLADLGFCKPVYGRTYTMCGTMEYIAPEVILNLGYGLPADWWSFGVLLYELCAGNSPFVNRDPRRQVEAISNGTYIMRNGFSQELEDLISNLLKTNPTERFGSHKLGIVNIRDHKWFGDMNWLDVLNKKVHPPFLPGNEVILDHVKHESGLKWDF